MADRNPGTHKATESPDAQAGVWNVHDGLHTAPVENHSDIDLMAIPPNKPRPIETTATSYLFGDFGD